MKLLKRQEESKKKITYIVSGTAAFIIFLIWVTIPLTHKSSWDTSVSNPYGMSKKTADLALLDSGGIDAPGAPLTGALIDNPATNLDLEASSLFKMPETEIKYEEEPKNENQEKKDFTTSTDMNVMPPQTNPVYAQQQVSSGKLAKLPSLGGSSGGTMTVGTVHDKFFGSQKAEANLVPLSSKSDDIKSTKGNLAISALKAVEKKSLAAMEAKSLEQSKGTGTSAFEKTAKVDEYILNSKEEKEVAQSGLSLAKAEADLKRSDPNLNKKKITLPQPKKDEDESKKMEEQIKMMLLQMILQATIGQVFGVIGQMMSMTICPQCYKKTTNTVEITTN